MNINFYKKHYPNKKVNYKLNHIKDNLVKLILKIIYINKMINIIRLNIIIINRRKF